MTFMNGESMGAPAPWARTIVTPCAPGSGPSKRKWVAMGALYGLASRQVIPTPEQLDAISQMEAGTLQEVPIAPLLLAQAVHRRTGVLEIRRRQVWKRVAFDHGVPVDCRSNLAHETLGRYMVIEGKLSDEDFTASLGRSASRGVPLGEELLERGLVTPDDLFRILQANLAKKLLDLFTWREGDFQTDGDLPTGESSLKIKVPDRKSTRLNSSHLVISYAVFCLKQKML